MRPFIFFYITLLFACKKTEPQAPIDYASLISNNGIKTWRLSDIKQNGQSVIEPCAKDDDYRFEAALSRCIYIPNGPCYSNDFERAMDYKINSGKKTISIDGLDYTINKASQTELILEYHADEMAANLRVQKALHNPQILYFKAN